MISSIFQLNKRNLYIIVSVVLLHFGCEKKIRGLSNVDDFKTKLGIPPQHAFVYYDLDACPTCTKYAQIQAGKIEGYDVYIVLHTNSRKKVKIFSESLGEPCCILWDNLGHGKQLQIETNKTYPIE